MFAGNINMQPHLSGIETALTATVEKRRTWP